MFDYTIIGSGPAGLTCATLLSSIGKKCLIIDREDSVGGCHRVRRVDNYFTEHGPRIYLSNYKNLIQTLESIDINFISSMKKYKFPIDFKEFIKTAKLKEVFKLVIYFSRFLITNKKSKITSVNDFVTKHNFSQPTIDYMDKICRLTDGAGIKRYTMFEFYQTINQNHIYKIYQPNKPNDLGLFKTWQDNLEKRGCKFLLGQQINSIEENNGLVTKIYSQNQVFDIQQLIIATPLTPMLNIFKNSSKIIQNCFSDFNKLIKYDYYNRYNLYIPVTFHWNDKIDLPDIWGSGYEDWGIIWIVLSDYMSFNNSGTVISACITKPDILSNHTGLTANQTSIKSDLVKEVFRQLKISLKNMRSPDKSILSPGVYRVNNKWKTNDSAFMRTKFSYPIRNKSKKIRNIFNVGTHNLKSWYDFTSIEAACSNAVYLSHKIEPVLKRKYPLKSGTTIGQLIFILIIIIFLCNYFI